MNIWEYADLLSGSENYHCIVFLDAEKCCINFIIAIIDRVIFNMRLINLLSLPLALLSGSNYLEQAQALSPIEKETLTAWKIQPVAIPIIDKTSAHQALLSRQKQLTNKDFTCDCHGCRAFAQQSGITLN